MYFSSPKPEANERPERPRVEAVRANHCLCFVFIFLFVSAVGVRREGFGEEKIFDHGFHGWARMRSSGLWFMVLAVFIRDNQCDLKEGMQRIVRPCPLCFHCGSIFLLFGDLGFDDFG